MGRARGVFEWLVDGAPGASSSPEIVARLGDDLRASGIPLDRLAAFVTTLHPSVVGRAFYWSPGAAVRVGELSLAQQAADAFVKSPVYDVVTARREVRVRIAELAAPHAQEVIRDLGAAGMTDYLCLPMEFTSGEVHAISFATRAAAGFTDADLAELREIVRPLSRVAEIKALRRTAATFLSTYVGHDSGERILAGRIHRGDVETVRAVVWFSDLRGFTEMSARMEPRAVIDTLNELFDCQVPPIERRRGEVLKFIGDGLLAIFPCAEERATPERCADALDAAVEAFALLDARNAASARPIGFGVALHVGEIAYGNVGGASRLDFTAIGAAVNLAARLEGLTGKLGRRVVVSDDFARHAARPMEELGAFELKGVPGPRRVLAPRG